MKNKHIDIRYPFLREVMLDNKFELVYIESENNISDILTKPLWRQLLIKHR